MIEPLVAVARRHVEVAAHRLDESRDVLCHVTEVIGRTRGELECRPGRDHGREATDEVAQRATTWHVQQTLADRTASAVAPRLVDRCLVERHVLEVSVECFVGVVADEHLVEVGFDTPAACLPEEVIFEDLVGQPGLQVADRCDEPAPALRLVLGVDDDLLESTDGALALHHAGEATTVVHVLQEVLGVESLLGLVERPRRGATLVLDHRLIQRTPRLRHQRDAFLIDGLRHLARDGGNHRVLVHHLGETLDRIDTGRRFDATTPQPVDLADLAKRERRVHRQQPERIHRTGQEAIAEVALVEADRVGDVTTERDLAGLQRVDGLAELGLLDEGGESLNKRVVLGCARVGHVGCDTRDRLGHHVEVVGVTDPGEVAGDVHDVELSGEVASDGLDVSSTFENLTGLLLGALREDAFASTDTVGPKRVHHVPPLGRVRDRSRRGGEDATSQRCATERTHRGEGAHRGGTREQGRCSEGESGCECDSTAEGEPLLPTFHLADRSVEVAGHVAHPGEHIERTLGDRPCGVLQRLGDDAGDIGRQVPCTRQWCAVEEATALALLGLEPHVLQRALLTLGQLAPYGSLRDRRQTRQRRCHRVCGLHAGQGGSVVGDRQRVVA